MKKVDFFNEIENVLGIEKGTIHSDLPIKRTEVLGFDGYHEFYSAD